MGSSAVSRADDYTVLFLGRSDAACLRLTEAECRRPSCAVRTKRWWRPVRKTVDVFLKDKKVASYPVIVEGIDRPTDDAFIARVKEQMQSYYSSEDIQRARFLVRNVLDSRRKRL